MNRKRRTEEELKKASEDLFYEVWMFTNLARGMASGVFNDGVIKNALLESFCIHTRVPLDFLFAEKPRDDDIIAEDYFSSPEKWAVIKTTKSENLQHIHHRVGKEVTHLTYARQLVTLKAKEWNFIDIANEINQVFDQFLALVPGNFLSTSLQKSIKQESLTPNSYYVYENWVAEGHKARIHFGHCPFCIFGKGMHHTENEENGRWHGPFTSFEEAFEVATKTGAYVSKCMHCVPC
jgi:hypothetical protein